MLLVWLLDESEAIAGASCPRSFFSVVTTPLVVLCCVNLLCTIIIKLSGVLNYSRLITKLFFGIKKLTTTRNH